MGLRFSWDPHKAVANFRKHGVSFHEAATAFADPHSITMPDVDHSVSERRFVLLGRSNREHLLVVVHAEREESEIRIISARLASRRERHTYEEED
jgi:uncharacterized DUF497 family protein